MTDLVNEEVFMKRIREMWEVKMRRVEGREERRGEER